MSRNFTHRSARSTPFVGVLTFLVVVESVGMHLLLHQRHPALAWTLSALGIATLYWIVADAIQLGRTATEVTAGAIVLRVGKRASATLPRDAVASATIPTWRDIPPRSPDFINLTKPVEPNVLLAFREPVTVVLLGAVRRPVRAIALRVDDPAGFIAAVTA
ncbi:MAG TPA: hypothetical protein VG916_09395 [Gemmatimonadaceae bacterium]|nr:hypothetical protein [Gemmatimonadaceae bacterium]